VVDVTARRIDEIVCGSVVDYTADTMLRLSWFLRTVEQFWLYLQACCALEVDQDRLGAALDDIRPPSAASWPQRNKDHGARRAAMSRLDRW
jgi:plasmid maintenance system antidote protein VapI